MPVTLTLFYSSTTQADRKIFLPHVEYVVLILLVVLFRWNHRRVAANENQNIEWHQQHLLHIHLKTANISGHSSPGMSVAENLWVYREQVNSAGWALSSVCLLHRQIKPYLSPAPVPHWLPLLWRDVVVHIQITAALGGGMDGGHLQVQEGERWDQNGGLAGQETFK